MVQEAYEATFGTPVGSRSAELEVPASDTRSPIVKSIFTISQLLDFQDGVTSRTLTVFSDMLEHVDNYSQYSKGDVLDFDRFIKTAYGTGTMPDLAGVDVEILY